MTLFNVHILLFVQRRNGIDFYLVSMFLNGHTIRCSNTLFKLYYVFAWIIGYIIYRSIENSYRVHRIFRRLPECERENKGQTISILWLLHCSSHNLSLQKERFTSKKANHHDDTKGKVLDMQMWQVQDQAHRWTRHAFQLPLSLLRCYLCEWTCWKVHLFAVCCDKYF